MNRYQNNNNDEISVYVCRGDVCNRVSLDGRGLGQGRVKENYDAPTAITLDSIATKISDKIWMIRGNVTILSTQKLTINDGEILNVVSGSLTNKGIVDNKGTLECTGDFINHGSFTNNNIFSTLNLQLTGGIIMNYGIFICKTNGAVLMTGVLGNISFDNAGKIIIMSASNLVLKNVFFNNPGKITNDGEIIIFTNTSINNTGEILNNNMIQFAETEGIDIYENNIINGSNGRCMLGNNNSDCNINHVVSDY